MADHEKLGTAEVLLFGITVDLTRMAAQTLGAGNGGNRQVEILLAVHQHPDITPSSLAESLGMSRSSMSHALARFEADALVERHVDERDHRSSRLRLSARGRKRVRAFEAALSEVLEERACDLRRCAELFGHPATDAGAADLTVLEAGERLSHAGEAYVAAVGAALRQYGATEPRERYVLGLVRERGHVRPAELAATLHMSSSGICTLLDRLEAAQLIRRLSHTDLADGRAVQVTLTDKGASAAHAALDLLAQHAEPLASALASALVRTAEGAA